MAGFLDKNNQVIDMVLTAEGRRLLSKGELKYVYWIPFDDEVDYNPYISNSGSLTSAQLSASINEQIEETLVREANRGYFNKNQFSIDTVNVHNTIFTIPQGQTVLPKMVSLHRTGSLDINVKQEKVVDKMLQKDFGKSPISTLQSKDRGFRRFAPTNISLEYRYTPDSYPDDKPLDGFLVRVYASGSGGLIEVDTRLDMEGNPSFRNDLTLVSNASKVLKRASKIKQD